MKRNVIEKQEARTVWSLIAMVIIGIVSLTYVLLFGWAFMNSFKGTLEFATNLFGFPEKIRFSNYVDTFSSLFVLVRNGPYLRKVYLLEMTLWGFYFGVVPAIVNTLACAVCSYTLAKYKFRGNNLIFNVLIFVMILPIIGSLPSTLQFTHQIGMYDKPLWVIVSNCTIWTGNWLILVATYKGISWEYAEAAFIDGAGHWQIFIRIMLPMSKTVLLVLILLKFIALWNDYNTSLIWFPSYPTLAYGLYYFQQTSTGSASEPIQLAAAVLSAVPSLILFLCFKEKMMNSLTMGGLKG